MRPSVFAELDFDAALTRAAEEKKLLLVDTMASWCGPCQLMDRTTWVDPKVVAALADRAITIQIDVDADADVAARLHVKAMPTIVAFENGVERDRVVGLQRSAQLLQWLDALSRGETSLQRLRRDAAASPNDMHLRMELAGRLVDFRELDAATEEFAWLWKHMLQYEPAMYGVRRSHLVKYIEELVQQHPSARVVFSAIRDEVAPGDAPLDVERVADWFCLNNLLGESQAILTWLDANHERAVRTPRLLHMLEMSVVPLLVDAGRWVDVARLYPTPLRRLRDAAKQRDEMLALATGHAILEGSGDHLVQHAHRALRESTTRLVRALRAANRVEEAESVSEEARRLDPSPEMASALELPGAASRS